MAAASKTIELTIHSAEQIKNVYIFSKMNAYIVGTLSGETHATPVRRDCGRNPTWNHKMKFTYEEAAAKEGRLNIEMRIKAHGGCMGDTQIGEAFISVKELIDKKQKEGEKRVNVRRPSGKVKGAIRISYKFLDDHEKPAADSAAVLPPQQLKPFGPSAQPVPRPMNLRPVQISATLPPPQNPSQCGSPLPLPPQAFPSPPSGTSPQQVYSPLQPQQNSPYIPSQGGYRPPQNFPYPPPQGGYPPPQNQTYSTTQGYQPPQGPFPPSAGFQVPPPPGYQQYPPPSRAPSPGGYHYQSPSEQPMYTSRPSPTATPVFQSTQPHPTTDGPSVPVHPPCFIGGPPRPLNQQQASPSYEVGGLASTVETSFKFAVFDGIKESDPGLEKRGEIEEVKE